MLADDGRVVSNFIVQALMGEDLTIYGDGDQTRSFCYVDDLIEGFIRFMNQTETVGPMNLGNPGEFTIRELAEHVIRLTGSSSKIVSRPLPSDDPRQRQPDITLARRVLDWEPTIQLEAGSGKDDRVFPRIASRRDAMLSRESGVTSPESGIQRYAAACGSVGAAPLATALCRRLAILRAPFAMFRPSGAFVSRTF